MILGGATLGGFSGTGMSKWQGDMELYEKERRNYHMHEEQESLNAVGASAGQRCRRWIQDGEAGEAGEAQKTSLRESAAASEQ